MNDYYFTSDLHLGHKTLLRGYRGKIFKTIEEHDKTIIENLLSIPRGSNLIIAGDLFWKYASEQTVDFFNNFNKRKINLHLLEGNHDKSSQWKNNSIKSIDQIKNFVINKQPITVCHYPLAVYSRSHYNAWNLFGHIHYRDMTWNRTIGLSEFDTFSNGKRLNINTELNGFKPWSFDEIVEEMKSKSDNWDFISEEAKKEERSYSEDFKFENGNYENRCLLCGKSFIGYKRRIICKRCSTKEN